MSWTFAVPRWHFGKQRALGSHSRPGCQGYSMLHLQLAAELAVDKTDSLCQQYPTRRNFFPNIPAGLLRASSAYALKHAVALEIVLGFLTKI